MGKDLQPTRLTVGRLGEDARAIVRCGALDVSYFGSASVVVDLVTGHVQCVAVDQKTPARETVDPHTGCQLVASGPCLHHVAARGYLVDSPSCEAGR